MTADRDLIIETTTRAAWYARHCRFRESPDLFADEVFDYTSLAGGKPTRVRSSESAASWKSALSMRRS